MAEPLATRVVVALRPGTALAPLPARGPAAANLLRGDLRLLLIQPVLALLDTLSPLDAAQVVMQRAQRGDMAPVWQSARQQLKRVSAASLARWVREHRAGKPLVDAYRGRVRLAQGWHLRAQLLFQDPVRRDMGDVADMLREEGWDVQYQQVRRYLNSLPSTQTTHHRRRLGAGHHKNNVRRPQERDVSDLKPGEAWVADGHKIKLISRDAASGHLRRLELTPILCVRSNFMLGAWWSFAESAEATVFAFCSVAQAVGGFPVWFYSDVGSGFDNARTAALFVRAGSTHVMAKPGMPSSKGFGEGVMKIIKKRFSKRYESYCGLDRTDDLIARFRTRYKRGEIAVPTDDEVIASFREWATHYNTTPQPGSKRLGGLSPAAFVQQAGGLTLAPIEIPIVELLRPEYLPVVRRGQVVVENRTYWAGLLDQYEGERLRVQIDPNEESKAWAFDAAHRYLGELVITDKVPWAREDAAADAREKSRQAALKRKQIQMERIDEQYGDAPLMLSVLNAGHSLTPPRRLSLVAPAAEAPLDAAALNAALSEPAVLQHDADAAFARALRLERDGCADAADGEWLRIYQTSVQYRSRRDLHDEFNAL
ncbi:MAG: Mu transposase C-terminal domain-containing protein [Panacagrimonas sp.]